MKRVYVAGPIGALEGRAQRVRDAIAVGEMLWRAGLWPFVPHLFVQWGEIFDHHYEEWMALDQVWLDQCDAVFRMPGHSPGADREVMRAESLGIRVFTDLTELRRWARGEAGGAVVAPPDPALFTAEVTEHNAEMAEYLADIQRMDVPMLGLEVEALRGDVAILDEVLSEAREAGESLKVKHTARDRLRLAEREWANRREAGR